MHTSPIGNPPTGSKFDLMGASILGIQIVFLSCGLLLSPSRYHITETARLMYHLLYVASLIALLKGNVEHKYSFTWTWIILTLGDAMLIFTLTQGLIL